MDQAYCDALRFAIEYEREGERQYRSAAEQATNKFAGRALSFLADEEVEHIRKITEFNQHLLGKGEFDLEAECSLTLPGRVEDFIKTTRASQDEKDGPLTDLGVYDLAMSAEKQGFDMYSSVRDSSPDPRLKTFFGFLADEERLHHKLLSESKRYLEDSSYYFEDAGGWIFS